MSKEEGRRLTTVEADRILEKLDETANSLLDEFSDSSGMGGLDSISHLAEYPDGSQRIGLHSSLWTKEGPLEDWNVVLQRPNPESSWELVKSPEQARQEMALVLRTWASRQPWPDGGH